MVVSAVVFVRGRSMGAAVPSQGAVAWRADRRRCCDQAGRQAGRQAGSIPSPAPLRTHLLLAHDDVEADGVGELEAAGPPLHGGLRVLIVLMIDRQKCMCARRASDVYVGRCIRIADRRGLRPQSIAFLSPTID